MAELRIEGLDTALNIPFLLKKTFYFDIIQTYRKLARIVFFILITFYFIFFFLSFFLSFFLPFLLSCMADRVLVLWPGVRPMPLRWESQVQDIGPPETSRLHVISNDESSQRSPSQC